MNESQPNKIQKTKVNVLLKNEASGKVSAMVLGLPEYRVESSNRVEALTSLQELLASNLAEAEIVSLEITQPVDDHPWMKFAGVFQNDPNFDEMIQDIKQMRKERDSDAENY